jgi:dTDP-4-amino-4,6-dideoxygalactose transaminase
MRPERNIRSASPFFDEKSIHKILKNIESALRNGQLTDGPNVRNFETDFANYIGVKHAIAVNSGTSALEIALRHFKLNGREVIVPTNTFVATPNSVLFAGGKPVFVDIKENTLCIDPEDVKHKVSQRTAGIIVVHIAGLICPQIKELIELCKDSRMFLLEDAAHAHGALINGRKAGALGDAGCFSFYPTKVITSGEGGMITTDSPDLAKSALCMRNHGQNAHRQMIMLGHNWRMNEIAAIIGRHQLENLEKFLIKRNKIADLYENALANIREITLFKTPPRMRHSYYKYPIRLDNKFDREELAAALRMDYGIETGNVYDPPCHLHPFYKKNFGTRKGDLPTAEKVLAKVLCLPMHYDITRKDVEYVSKALRESIGKLSN